MNKKDLSRVQRSLDAVADALEIARSRAAESDREIAGVLGKSINELRKTTRDISQYRNVFSFEDFKDLLKVLGYFVDLVKDLLDTLSCRSVCGNAAFNR